MTGSVRITEIPADERVRLTAATWSLGEWGRYYPDDTVQAYLDWYASADADPDSIPIVLVAWDGDDIVGTAALVPDDELPDPQEPGPWVAAVFVAPSHRGRGIGRALVDGIVERARGLGYERIWLYTHETAEWYVGFGWTIVRTASVHGHEVTVMTLSL